MRITNNFTMLPCRHCHTDNLYFTQDDSGCDFSVCHHCGYIEARRSFNALDYIVQLIHDDITKENEIVEILTDKLSDEYDWLEFLDVELMAKLLVKELYDEARLTAEAEDNEITDYLREVQNSRREMVLGVA